MDTSVKSYREIAEQRVTEQFKDKRNIDRVLAMWLDGYQEVQEVILDLFDVLEIEQARGDQLDKIGAIVGQPREVVEINLLGYFGFEEDTSAQKFGSIYNNEGGVYYSLLDPEQGSIELTDRVYRLFIEAKIISNNTGGTIEDIIEVAKRLFQTDSVEVNELDDLTIGINVGGRAWNDTNYSSFPGLDETDIARRLLPVPPGVSLEFLNEPIKDSPLSFINTWVDASDRLWETANVILPQNLNF